MVKPVLTKGRIGFLKFEQELVIRCFEALITAHKGDAIEYSARVAVKASDVLIKELDRRNKMDEWFPYAGREDNG